MTRTAIIALLLSLVAIGVLSLRQENAPPGAWLPSGYIAKADSLIRQGHLVLDCPNPLDTLSKRKQDSIVVRFPRGSDDERYYQLSYLINDVRLFNSDPELAPGPFLIDGCQLTGVDPYFHRIALPYASVAEWRGDIRVSGGGTVASLDNPGPPQLLQVRHPVDPADAFESRTVYTRTPGEFESALLLFRRPSDQGALAESYFVGQNVVLADRRSEQSTAGGVDTFSIGGYLVPPGRVARLQTGDWIRFASSPPVRAVTPGSLPARQTTAPSQSSTYLATVGADTRVVSFVRTQNARSTRVFVAEPLNPFLRPLSRAIELTIQGGTRRGDADPRASKFNVQLTLERQLDKNLRDSTLADCRRRPDGRRPRVVSILLMDAFSGAVRAMASCPDVEQLKPFEPMASRERERWLRNQNLVRHEIGSAGKPFWAAAIASRHPALLDFSIPDHPVGSAETALGCKLASSYDDHAHSGVGGWVGMESFIAGSCNRFIVEMATAALMVSPTVQCSGPLTPERMAACFLPSANTTAAPNQVKICDRIVSLVLSDRSPFVAGNSCENLKLLGSDFEPAASLRDIANVDFYYQGAPDRLADKGGKASGLETGYRYQRYRADVWRTLLDSLSQSSDRALDVSAGLRFAAVSPEATNLQLNSVTRLREHWINILLGGSTSKWSNFQLAESMSRLMTGREVTGSFVDAIDVTGDHIVTDEEIETPDYKLLGDTVLNGGVRRRVLHGMELVATEGTASALAPHVANLRRRLAAIDPNRGYELYVFGKTGTPAVTQRDFSTHEQRVLDALWARGMHWSAADSLVQLSPAATSYLAALGARDRFWIETQVLAPLHLDPSEYTERRGGQLPRHPFFIRNQQLVSQKLFSNQVEGQAGVLVLGFLAVPRESGRGASQRFAEWISSCIANPGLRSDILGVPPTNLLDPKTAVGLSAAIHINDLSMGQGSAEAVGLASRIFGIVGDELERQVRVKLAKR